ncbi:MAG: hypothetical protein AAF639_39295 [Chloroflexota bacterium]
MDLVLYFSAYQRDPDLSDQIVATSSLAKPRIGYLALNGEQTAGTVVHGAVYAPTSLQRSFTKDTDTNRFTFEGDMVTESCPVAFGGTTTEVKAFFSQLEQLLRTAEERHRRNGYRAKPVYVAYRANNHSEWYQSELISGRIVLPESKAERAFHRDWVAGTLQVEWTRLPYWSKVEAVSLVNANITNGSKQNIHYAHVIGAMRSPARVTVSVGAAGHIWIGNHVGYTANFMDTTLNGGSLSWDDNHPQIHKEAVCRSALSHEQLDHCQGRMYRLIACVSSATVGVYIQGHLVSNTAWIHLGTPGNERRLSGGAQMVDLGTFALPPGGTEATNDGVEFILTARSPVAGSVALEQVVILPAYNLVHLEMVAGSGTVVYDEQHNLAYVANGHTRAAFLRKHGGALWVYPNETQAITVLWANRNGGANLGQSAAVTVDYAPRIDTIG